MYKSCSHKRFCYFLNSSNSASNFAYFDTHIKIIWEKFFEVIIALFAHFQVKRAKNSSKNVFYKCVLEFNFESISVSGLLIFSKKVICVSKKFLCTLHTVCSLISYCAKTYSKFIVCTAMTSTKQTHSRDSKQQKLPPSAGLFSLLEHRHIAIICSISALLVFFVCLPFLCNIVQILIF